jgi:hypothetical protein
MNDPIEMVAGLVALNDGELVGKSAYKRPSTFSMHADCKVGSTTFHFLWSLLCRSVAGRR